MQGGFWVWRLQGQSFLARLTLWSTSKRRPGRGENASKLQLGGNLRILPNQDRPRKKSAVA